MHGFQEGLFDVITFCFDGFADTILYPINSHSQLLSASDMRLPEECQAEVGRWGGGGSFIFTKSKK